MSETHRDIEKAAGQMLMAGFEGSDPEPPEAIAEALREGRIGGTILFSRNVEDLDQVVALNRRLHELAAEGGQRPLVAIDQEGGPVMRLREGMTPIPPMREVGEAGAPSYIADVSQVIAGELRA
ncbi:MAG: glycoside hydrolase family 3 N-terminal domain-containing protein, partial [Bradymonadaceae bacterium]